MSSEPAAPLDELAGELYSTLHSLAGRALGRSSRLDPTDLVHQAWVRLAHSDQDPMPRSEFLALCATIMRRLAVDEGRRRFLERREPERITLSGFVSDAPGAQDDQVDLIALDEALTKLKEVDERWARIVELRFFGGLSGEDVSLVMGLSRRTVTREWTLARAWLKRKLSEA